MRGAGSSEGPRRPSASDTIRQPETGKPVSYLAASWATVSWPLTASSATLALKAGLYFLRPFDISHSFPTANDDGPTALLLREYLVKQYIADEGLTLCSVVMGEKWVIGGQSNRGFHGALKIQGVYRLTDQGPDGQLRFQIEIPESE